jgi:hypothetical protein
LLISLTNLTQGVRSVAFSPDGNYLAAAGSSAILMWQSSNWKPCWTNTTETVGISSLSFSPNGTSLVFGRDDGTASRILNPLGALSPTPLISMPLSAMSITFGQTLASSTLSGAFTNAAGLAVTGTLAFDNPALAPMAGTTNVPVIFTPTDTADYNTVTNLVNVLVNPAISPIQMAFTGMSPVTNNYGVTNIILTGELSGAGPVYPASGEMVSASINGFAVSGTVTNDTGGFWINYNDPSLATNAACDSPHAITYTYAGNAGTSLSPATDSSTWLTITNSLQPCDAWKLACFGADANNPAIAGDTADPQHDGIVNLLAYAYAFNPLVVNTNPFTGDVAGNEFQLNFPRNLAASDITYNVQGSGDLNLWTNLLTFTAATGWVTNVAGASVAESMTNGLPPNQYVNVTATTTTNVTGSATNQFVRLQIHR